jgi:membrane fusion protein, heavy metal efflux system
MSQSKRRFRLFIFSRLLLLLTMSSLLSGCTHIAKAPDVPALAGTSTTNKHQVKLTPGEEIALGIQTQVVGPLPFTETIQSNGQVQADEERQTHVFSTAPGKALRVFAVLGQTVSQGDVLASIKSDQIGQLESDLLQQDLQNNADIKQGEVQLQFSKLAYEREQTLYNDRVSAKVDMETAKTQYLKDVASLAALKTKKQATIDTAQNRLSLYGVGSGDAEKVIKTHHIYPFLSITAPHSGVIIARSLNNGEVVDPSKEIFTVADLSRVWLIGNIYEKDVRHVHLGQPIAVTLDSYPDSVFSGKINLVSNVLDPQNRTLFIRGEVANPGTVLKPNMFARMDVETGTEKLLAIPHSAIQHLGDTILAYVMVQPHVYEERAINIGLDNGKYIQIQNGLKPGDVIAVRGTFGIKGKILKIVGMGAE